MRPLHRDVALHIVPHYMRDVVLGDINPQMGCRTMPILQAWFCNCGYCKSWVYMSENMCDMVCSRSSSGRNQYKDVIVHGVHGPGRRARRAKLQSPLVALIQQLTLPSYGHGIISEASISKTFQAGQRAFRTITTCALSAHARAKFAFGVEGSTVSQG